MRYIYSYYKKYKFIISFLDSLNKNEANLLGVPIFKKEKILIPFYISFQGENNTVYSLLNNLLKINSSTEYWILPIDNSIDLINHVFVNKTTKNIDGIIFDSGKQYCGIAEIALDDNEKVIAKFLSESDCFVFSQSYLTIDETQKWCFIDLEILPVMLFFCDKEFYDKNKNKIDGIVHSHGLDEGFKNIMTRFKVNKQFESLLNHNIIIEKSHCKG